MGWGVGVRTRYRIRTAGSGERSGGRPWGHSPLTEQFVSPSQFYGTPQLCPEKRLMLAVLEDAVVVLTTERRSHCAARERLRAETKAWFADEHSHELYSFLNICDTLAMDGGCIRDGLAAAVQPVIPRTRLQAGRRQMGRV